MGGPDAGVAVCGLTLVSITSSGLGTKPEKKRPKASAHESSGSGAMLLSDGCDGDEGWLVVPAAAIASRSAAMADAAASISKLFSASTRSSVKLSTDGKMIWQESASDRRDSVSGRDGSERVQAPWNAVAGH